jgi:regulator of sigma E protease
MQPQMFTERLGVVSGIRSGINRGAELYTLTVLGIQKMFQSSEAASQGLSGPVRIASISYRAAEQDVGQFLKLLAMISISLGILNLLPLPPLDGGHILFLLIEVVRGKPLGEEVLYKIQLAGFLFFIGLFILITYNDIVNLMG